MKITALVLLLSATAVVAGCAAPADSDSSSAEPREQREYRTGSNLPARVVRPKTKEEREQAARDAEQAQRDAEKIIRPGS